MKKTKEIIGLPIISIFDGTEIGMVKNIIINAEDRSFSYVVVENGLHLLGAKVIATDRILGIGEHAVTVEDDNVVSMISKIPAAMDLLEKNVQIRGSKVLTKKGRLVGEITEIYVDEEDRCRIKGMEFLPLRGDGSAKFLPDKCIVTYGRHLIIVTDVYESMLSDVAELSQQATEQSATAQQPAAQQAAVQQAAVQQVAVRQAVQPESHGQLGEHLIRPLEPAAQAMPHPAAGPAVSGAAGRGASDIMPAGVEVQDVIGIEDATEKKSLDGLTDYTGRVDAAILSAVPAEAETIVDETVISAAALEAGETGAEAYGVRAEEPAEAAAATEARAAGLAEATTASEARAEGLAEATTASEARATGLAEATAASEARAEELAEAAAASEAKAEELAEAATAFEARSAGSDAAMDELVAETAVITAEAAKIQSIDSIDAEPAEAIFKAVTADELPVEPDLSFPFIESTPVDAPDFQVSDTARADEAALPAADAILSEARDISVTDTYPAEHIILPETDEALPLSTESTVLSEFAVTEGPAGIAGLAPVETVEINEQAVVTETASFVGPAAAETAEIIEQAAVAEAASFIRPITAKSDAVIESAAIITPETIYEPDISNVPPAVSGQAVTDIPPAGVGVSSLLPESQDSMEAVIGVISEPAAEGAPAVSAEEPPEQPLAAYQIAGAFTDVSELSGDFLTSGQMENMEPAAFQPENVPVAASADETALAGVGIDRENIIENETSLFEQRQNNYLTGRIVTKAILDNRGNVLVEEGARITEDIIEKIKVNGRMVQLVMNNRS